jgi:hypothetical protein
MSKAFSLRYSPWLARDVLLGPGVLYLIIAVIVTVVVWRLHLVGAGIDNPGAFQETFFSAAALYGVLVATGGMVSGDLHNGFYRAWFSKAISPWWYYLQRFLLGAAVLLSMPLLLGLGLQLVAGNGLGLSGDLLLGLALHYLLIGSAVLLLSIFTRRDWLVVFLLNFAQMTVGKIAMSGVELASSLQLVHDILPPFHLLGFGGDLPSGNALLHVALYGAGMLMAALVLLRFRPLGSGGRA